MKMPVRIRAYMLAVSAPAVLTTAVLLGRPALRPDDIVLGLVLVAVGAVAANFPVSLSPRYKTDATQAILMAFVLLFSPAAGAALIGLSRLIGEGILCFRRNPANGKRRRRTTDLVFNTSQIMLTVAAGSFAYSSISAQSTSLIAPILGAIVAATFMYLVNSTLVSVAVGLMRKRNPIAIWTEVAQTDVPPTIALNVAGYLLAELSVGRPWLVLAMMVPVAGIQVALTRSLQLQSQTIAAVESMADVVDRRDAYTYKHSQSVAEHAVRIARKLMLPDKEVELVRLAARVHDLGKIAVPDEVLHKQGRLTEAEFELMKKHPETGAEILAKFPAYRRGRELVLAHHERMDGLGYPRGLKGAAIALGARIIAVADSWDAMTSDRPYRSGMDHDTALSELLRGRGTQWDSSVVDAFVHTLTGTAPARRPSSWPQLQGLVRSLGAAVGVIP